MHWRAETARADAMRGTGDDEALYATGWDHQWPRDTGYDPRGLGARDLARFGGKQVANGLETVAVER